MIAVFLVSVTAVRWTAVRGKAMLQDERKNYPL